MGPRNELELTPGDDELAADEAATRRLLAAFGEPTPAVPPRGLENRVVAGLPRSPARPIRPRRRAVGWAVGAALALLLILGAWGVLVNSLGPAEIAGGPAAGVGQLVLVLTLAAKPLVNLLAETGLSALLAILGAAGGAWLWWRTVRDTPLAPPVEAPL